MAQRIVTDTEGRVWTCDAPAAPQGKDAQARSTGRDVKLSCTTPSIRGAVLVTVSWAWEKMADNGLARMISLAAVPQP
jgi:hypothetical protein